MVKYFFDSYAIIEIIKGNPNYAKYASEPVTTSLFNLIEVYWNVLNEGTETKANETYDKFRDSVVEINDETLKKAVKFRKQNKKKNLSYTDCIGYVYAIENNLIFLTGDKEFKETEKVEYIK